MKYLILFFPVALFAFVIDPWMTTVGELQFRPAYSYRYYPSVDQGFNPSSYNSHDHFIDLNLGVQFWPGWEVQLETDFLSTRKLNWGVRRVGGQLRYQVFNDVAGDPISLILGGQAFYVPTRTLRDVSSPYHAQGNFELGLAAGKEIDQTYNWVWRFWGFFGAGVANRGSPWLRPLLAIETKIAQHYKFKLFSEGYFGLGNQSRLNIDNFKGYARIEHRSVDLGLNYTYLFKIWGELGVQYAYRIYAYAFPRHAQTVRVEYRLPFSVF
ncbi:hypothetical protein [Candidatus Neptunochlamydia vexilliferae]|nr:hypothetical protein [Candidatus Neptunochlamydia vexilliferae]